MGKTDINTAEHVAGIIGAIQPESYEFKLMGEEVQRIIFDFIKDVFENENLKLSSGTKVKINNQFFKTYKQFKLEFKDKIKATGIERLETCKTVMAYSLDLSDPVKNREGISTEKLVQKIRNELKEIIVNMVNKKQEGRRLDCGDRSCPTCWDLTC